LKVNDKKAYETIEVTNTKISMVWSWNEINCLITGEAASWKDNWAQVAI